MLNTILGGIAARDLLQRGKLGNPGVGVVVGVRRGEPERRGVVVVWQRLPLRTVELLLLRVAAVEGVRGGDEGLRLAGNRREDAFLVEAHAV